MEAELGVGVVNDAVYHGRLRMVAVHRRRRSAIEGSVQDQECVLLTANSPRS